MKSTYVLVLFLVASILAGGAAGAGESYTLQSGREPGSTARLEVLLEVGGELKVAEEGKLKSLKMKAIGKLAYHERLLAAGDAGPNSMAKWRAVRHYERADAVIDIESRSVEPRLRHSRRLIAVDASEPRLALFSPHGPLTREELDLLDVPGNSLLIESLLPDKPVAIGDQWTHDDALIAALVGLDAVSQAEVTSQLTFIDAQAARMELVGRVHGAVGGVSTEMELKGKYHFDVAARRITRLALLIQDKRSVGPVAPGVDVVAKLQLSLTPVESAAELDDGALEGLDLSVQPALSVLEYQSPGGQFRFQHDRRWHVMGDKPDQMAMRLVDRGELVAQCNVQALAPLKPGTATSLAEFQADIKRSLAKNFGQFVQASEASSSQGYRVYRVVAAGLVSELPIQWIYYLAADAEGRRVVFAFTVEEGLLEQLAGADEQVVATLELLSAADTGTPEPPPAASRGLERAGRRR